MNEKDEEIKIKKDWTQHNQLENIVRVLLRIDSHLLTILLSVIILIGIIVYIFIYNK